MWSAFVLPVEDMEIPTYRAIKFILDTIDRAVEEGKPVYVALLGRKRPDRDPRRLQGRQTRKGRGL